jgi:hypothetical protein
MRAGGNAGADAGSDAGASAHANLPIAPAIESTATTASSAIAPVGGGGRQAGSLTSSDGLSSTRKTTGRIIFADYRTKP